LLLAARVSIDAIETSKPIITENSIEAVQEPAIPTRKDFGIAILLVTFLLKKSDIEKPLFPFAESKTPIS